MTAAFSQAPLIAVVDTLAVALLTRFGGFEKGDESDAQTG
jgi:hypothetical protein